MAKTELTLQRLAEDLICDHHLTLEDFTGSPDEQAGIDAFCTDRLQRALVQCITRRKAATLGRLAQGAMTSPILSEMYRRVKMPAKVAGHPYARVRFDVLIALMATIKQELTHRERMRLLDAARL